VAKSAQTSSASVEHISRSILVLRGQRVLLDIELADLYGVATKALLQAVRRNRERFPEDFMIQLTDPEWIISGASSGLRADWRVLRPCE
jgi:ORF6N domain